MCMHEVINEVQEESVAIEAGDWQSWTTCLYSLPVQAWSKVSCPLPNGLVVLPVQLEGSWVRYHSDL